MINYGLEIGGLGLYVSFIFLFDLEFSRFVVGGIAAIVTGFLTAGLPRELKVAAENLSDLNRELKNEKVEKKLDQKLKLSEIFKSRWLAAINNSFQSDSILQQTFKLFRNWPFLCLIGAGSFEGMFYRFFRFILSLRSKKAGSFEELLGFSRSHSIVTRAR